MNKSEFVNGITLLSNAYDNEFDNNKLATWYNFFKDYNAKEFYKVINAWISNNTFMPKINELLNEFEVKQEHLIEEKLNLDELIEWFKNYY